MAEYTVEGGATLDSMTYGWQQDEPNYTTDRWAFLGDCLRRSIGWSLLAQLLAQAMYASLPILAAIPRAPISIEGIGGLWPWHFVYLAIQHSILIGILNGFFAGVCTGLALAALTIGRSRTLSTALAFRRVARTMAVAVAVLVASGVRVTMIQYGYYPWFGVPEFTGALVLPGLAGWWVGGRVANWLLANVIPPGLRQ